MKIKIAFSAVLLSFLAWDANAQTSITFQPRYRIYLKGNTDFPIMYTDKKIMEKVSAVTYDNQGKVISTAKIPVEIWDKGTKADFSQYTEIAKHKYLYADVVQSEDKSKLYIYFWPFNNDNQQAEKTASQKTLDPSEEKFDKSVRNGSYYIELKDRDYLKITKAAKHAGPLTIPFKVYLTSRDTGRAGNITAGVNVSGYYGWKWGKQGFGNLPGEKTGNTHERFISFNLIGGFSTVDITAATNIKGDKRAGTGLAFNSAAGFGYHYDSFGIFAVAGMDIPFGNITENWRYKYQPWIGFGIGFSIL